jgi:hypothetical protein
LMEAIMVDASGREWYAQTRADLSLTTLGYAKETVSTDGNLQSRT